MINVAVLHLNAGCLVACRNLQSCVRNSLFSLRNMLFSLRHYLFSLSSSRFSSSRIRILCMPARVHLSRTIMSSLGSVQFIELVLALAVLYMRAKACLAGWGNAVVVASCGVGEVVW